MGIPLPPIADLEAKLYKADALAAAGQFKAAISEYDWLTGVIAAYAQ